MGTGVVGLGGVVMGMDKGIIISRRSGEQCIARAMRGRLNVDSFVDLRRGGENSSLFGISKNTE